MPGLNALISFNGRPKMNQDRASKILDDMDYDLAYSHETLYSDRNTTIYFSGYKGYPRQKIELGDKVLLIEGAIYNKSIEQVKTELVPILSALAGGSKNSDPLREFMFGTDGEFIIYYIDNASSTVIIFNDAMGRLPVYHHDDKEGFVMTRAMKFMTAAVQGAQFDENAMMEYFLFSVPLGNKSLFKDIYRLMPCSLITINVRKGIVNKERLHTYSFDDRWEDKPREEYVGNLHDLFLAGVSNRSKYFSDRKHVLSLSGGLDSRTNLMALLKLKIDFQVISFRDYFNFLGRDYPVVKTLDKMYNLNVKYFRLIEENIPYFERMVAVKDGTAMMGTMGSVLNSMEIAEREFGRNTVYYTGDEGNYTTAPRYGGGKMSSTPELVKQILLKNSLSLFSIDEVAAAFNKAPKEVMDHLCAYFEKYPEKDNVHKVDHFFIWERSFKFTMENQDRIRLFFWPMAPHYSIQYVRYAFQIKNKYLGGWKVYRDLLRSLDRRSTGVKYSNFGIALDSRLMPVYLPVRALATGNETVRRNLLVVLRLLKNPASIGRKSEEWDFIGQFGNYIGNLIDENPSLSSHFNTDFLKKHMASQKFLFKMYLTGNLLKYMTLVEGKKEMAEAVA